MPEAKSGTSMGIAPRLTLLILVAVAVLAGFGLFVLLVFVPVAGWYLWRMQDRIAALEKRIAELEGKPRR